MPGKDGSQITGSTDPAKTQFLMEEDDDLAELDSDFAAPFERGTCSGANQIPWAQATAAHLADEVFW
jgi:hypothetical protein